MSTFKAKIVSVSPEIKTKVNGGETQLCQALVTEGPLKGMTVLSTRTIKNAKGVAKPRVEANQEVTLWHTQLESTTKPGTMQNFFEIQIGSGATQDDINALLANASGVNVTNALAEQAV